ncbi:MULTISPECIES: AI-2E family transporter [Spirosoma]|uniref:AI-2E family transporter n=1 Tax=Spirosoma liriopis TaxID=2937440 RepID=A0ABT0HJ68_9BACT|nr:MULTISPECIES: AI-2E family transporter [Spirosoma]MCK8492211.1 AI-2E family transporter [Spirosoma liriopis]UHG91628.1 AI-2E family transporter [Spirosoma oryzicola]
MDTRAREIKLPLYAKISCVLLSLVIIIYGLHALHGLLIPLVFAILFSVLLFPLAQRLENWRLPRILAIILCLILTLAVIVGILYAVSMQISSFAEVIPQLIKRGNEYLGQLQTYADERLNIDRQRQVAEVRKYLNQALAEGGTILTSTLLATTSTLTDVFLVLLFIFFFLLYRDFFRSFFYRAFNGTRRSKIDAVLSGIYNVVKDYLAGLVLVILIIGTLMTIGLFILGIDYAIFFGFFGACLVLIPYFGISMGSLLPAAYALVTQDNPLKALGVIGVFLFVQTLEGNFITPYIVGSKVSINPLAAIIVLILWENVWGFPGLVLALPMTAIIKVIFDAVESLNPYGFLIGEAEKPRPPIKNFQQLADHLPKRAKKIGEIDEKT